MSVVPWSTRPTRCLAPLRNSIRSVTVVLPASMWAMMPMLRSLEISTVMVRSVKMLDCEHRLSAIEVSRRVLARHATLIACDGVRVTWRMKNRDTDVHRVAVDFEFR